MNIMMLDKLHKKSKSIIFIFMLILLSIEVVAQQDPIFTQYMHNPVSINPAYAGSRGTLNMVGMHRQQWVGLDGAPKTLSLSVNSPFLNYNVGIGLSLLYDVIGPVKQTGLYADYAYHLKVSSGVKLAFGLKGGVNIYDINLTGLSGDPNDELVNLNGYQKLYLPNFGFGTYLYSNRFYLGLSIPKMLQNSLSDTKNNNLANKEDRYYFFTGGLMVNLSENIKFKPSTIVRIVKGSPVSAELSAAVLLHDQLWIGGMFRNDGSLGGMVKFDFNNLSIGYSYEISQSVLRPYNQGTHEIYISYDIDFRNKKILSPRYF